MATDNKNDPKEELIKIELRNAISAYLMATSRSRQDKVVELSAKKIMEVFRGN